MPPQFLLSWGCFVLYYVYKFFRVDNGETLYIGKGSGNRYKVRCGRNKKLTEAFSKYDCQSEIIKYFENEKDAFLYEDKLISYYKNLGQCTCNLHKGGAGGSGEYWTDELRKEYSENNIMKTEEQRKRMSENNPMKNPLVSKRVAISKSRPVIINGIEYGSIKEVAKKYKTYYETVRSWCQKGINQYGEKCRFKDSNQVVFNDKRYNKGGSKPVFYENKIYEAAVDLAKVLGYEKCTVSRWAKRGYTNDGKICYYI